MKDKASSTLDKFQKLLDSYLFRGFEVTSETKTQYHLLKNTAKTSVHVILAIFFCWGFFIPNLLYYLITKEKIVLTKPKGLSKIDYTPLVVNNILRKRDKHETIIKISKVLALPLIIIILCAILGKPTTNTNIESVLEPVIILK